MRWDLVILGVIGFLAIFVIVKYSLKIAKIMLYTISLAEDKPIPPEFVPLKPRGRKEGDVKVRDLEEIANKFKGLM